MTIQQRLEQGMQQLIDRNRAGWEAAAPLLDSSRRHGDAATRHHVRTHVSRAIGSPKGVEFNATHTQQRDAQAMRDLAAAAGAYVHAFRRGH